ncbi:MAG TPA: membrane protein insertion efficiency factor YidD [Nitrospinota bacterium]|nr:membrane protein insertion efficiency factor YidD [Nitrospinota bacterium]
MKRVIIFLIRVYKLALSPLMPPACGYYPSCSQYAKEALERYGIFRGGIMAFRRLLRCTPFHKGGYDPVP